jgi:hypothetical protein
VATDSKGRQNEYFNEIFYFLGSTNLKLLRQIEVNSVNNCNCLVHNLR